MGLNESDKSLVQRKTILCGLLHVTHETLTLNTQLKVFASSQGVYLPFNHKIIDYLVPKYIQLPYCFRYIALYCLGKRDTSGI